MQKFINLLDAPLCQFSLLTENGGSVYVGFGIHGSKLLGALWYWLFLNFMG